MATCTNNSQKDARRTGVAACRCSLYPLLPDLPDLPRACHHRPDQGVLSQTLGLLQPNRVSAKTFAAVLAGSKQCARKLFAGNVHAGGRGHDTTLQAEPGFVLSPSTLVVTMRQLQSERSESMKRFVVRHSIALILPISMLVMAGCRDRTAETAAVDSLLSRDLTLAAGDTPARSLPAIGDTAISTLAAPAPAAPRPTAPPAVRPASRPSRAPRPSRQAVEPAPTPAPVAEAPGPAPTAPAPAPGPTPGPARGLAAGTALTGTTNAAICSLANRPGDRIVAELAEPVNGPDGATLPAGTPLLVEMTQPAVDGSFVFRVRSVQVNGELVPVQGTVRVGDNVAVTERQVSKGGDKGKVITGAIIGAIAGRVLGGGTRGTVIGAAGGAAAGTIAAARNTQTERCLPAGATLTVTLSAPLVFP